MTDIRCLMRCCRYIISEDWEDIFLRTMNRQDKELEEFTKAAKDKQQKERTQKTTWNAVHAYEYRLGRDNH